MIMVTGGSCEDKLGWCIKSKRLSIDITNYENKVLELQKYLRTAFDNNTATDKIYNYIEKFEIIFADEIGCGIVPVDKNERAFRDFYGFVCGKTAERAETVVRIICGIEQIIKGDLK